MPRKVKYSQVLLAGGHLWRADIPPTTVNYLNNKFLFSLKSQFNKCLLVFLLHGVFGFCPCPSCFPKWFYYKTVVDFFH